MVCEWDKAKNRKNFAKHGSDLRTPNRCFLALVSPLRMTVSTTEKNGLSRYGY